MLQARSDRKIGFATGSNDHIANAEMDNPATADNPNITGSIFDLRPNPPPGRVGGHSMPLDSDDPAVVYLDSPPPHHII